MSSPIERAHAGCGAGHGGGGDGGIEGAAGGSAALEAAFEPDAADGEEGDGKDEDDEEDDPLVVGGDPGECQSSAKVSWRKQGTRWRQFGGVGVNVKKKRRHTSSCFVCLAEDQPSL